MRQVLGRVRDVYSWASVHALVCRWDSGREHIGKDCRLCREEAAIDAKRDVLSDQGDVAVVEPEFLVVFESSWRLKSALRTLGA